MDYKDLVIKLSIEQRNNFDGYSAKGETKVSCDLSESEMSDIKYCYITMAIANAFSSTIGSLASRNGFNREDTETLFQDVMGKMHEINILRKSNLEKKEESKLSEE